MSYQLSIEERSGYLYVSVSGTNSAANVQAYFAEVSDACQRLHQTNVLIAANLSGDRLSMIEVYKTISAASDRVVDSGMRIAYVDPNFSHYLEKLHLAENIAAMRGLDARIFRNTAAAEAWLLRRPQPHT
jgi:hypothetical protein